VGSEMCIRDRDYMVKAIKKILESNLKNPRE